MAISYTQTINWCPFSQKHIDYIKKALISFLSCAEGSVRAGKTIDNCIIAQIFLDVCPDKIHLASGSTLANAKLNIGDCNGFGLEYQFRGRSHWGKYKDMDALYIKDCKNRDKIVVFAGGGKADSYKKILGNSYGLWIATEINEHYDCDNSKESFIKVAMARQIASKRRMILWDLNPSHPNHRIYTEYIDKYARDGLLGGYNYGHFTIDDNLSISEKRKNEIKSQYDPTSIWYKRDILGQRAVTEGLIFSDVASHPNDYVLTEIPKMMRINVGIDFGGNGSWHTFTATGIGYGYGFAVYLETQKHKPKDTITLEEQFSAFIKMLIAKYGAYIPKIAFNVYCDSAEQVLISSLDTRRIQDRLPINIMNAEKNSILERIRLQSRMYALKMLYFMIWNKEGLLATQQCVYDSRPNHEDERLDNSLTNADGTIDKMDSMEYSLEPEMNEFLKMIKRGGIN